MIVLSGTSPRGWVDGAGGELIATQFVHVWWLPLVPLRSVWVTGGDRRRPIGHAHRLSGRSVAAGYLRVWGPIVTIIGAATACLVGMAVALVAASLTGWSWWARHDRSGRRVALQRPVLGSACDPLALPRRLASCLLPRAEAGFAVVGAGRTPLDVALGGAGSPAQMAHAFVVLRLAAASAWGPNATAARIASERLLDRGRDDASAIDGPYRAAASMAPAPTAPMAPLLTSEPVASVTLHGWRATALATLVALFIPCGFSDLLFTCPCDESHASVALSMSRKLANEAYPQWSLRPGNADRCPTLDELGEYANNNTKDMWGRPYQVTCIDLPLAVGIGVWSTGENRRDERGQGDDLASWR